jgi:thioredoxin reductase (NADPH)
VKFGVEVLTTAEVTEIAPQGDGRVVLLCRGPDIRRSMSEYLVARIEASDVIEVRTCTEVAAVEGDEHVERLVLRDSVTGSTRTVPASRLFVFIGARPLTDWLGDAFDRDTPRAGPRWTGRCPARPTTWSARCPGCSWPATSAPSR